MIGFDDFSNKSTNILILILIVSVIIRLFFLHPTFSDENFYINVGKTILEGKTPYKDFFFAHPPLQVYTLAILFKVFGIFFLVGKSLTLITSSLCVFLLYLITKQLYDQKSGFTVAIIFLLTPAFLAFSTVGHGMWETTFLVLLSTYLLIKNKLPLAGLVFMAAVLFRYLAIIYLPFLIAFLYIRKQKIKNFLIPFLAVSVVSGLLLLSVFGSSYIDQTVSYQIFSKVALSAAGIQRMQYWGIGFFFLFLSLLSAFVAYTKKDRILLLFAIIPLISDTLILLGLRLVFYHYFLVSLAFCIITVGRILSVSKDWIIRLAIPVILLLSITSNIKTIDFYLSPSHAEKFYYIADFIANNTSEEDAIFGEPVMTNYISFITGRRISSNYLDSYLRHLMFDGEEKVIQNLNEDKPKFIIEMEGYYLSNPYFRDFILSNYRLEKSIEGIPNYSIYVLK
jgi:4-amino-4-deoxy-L-arabinose transferase-like glycosyltransferase